MDLRQLWGVFDLLGVGLGREVLIIATLLFGCCDLVLLITFLSLLVYLATCLCHNLIACRCTGEGLNQRSRSSLVMVSEYALDHVISVSSGFNDVK